MLLKITAALMLLLLPFYTEGALQTTDRYAQSDAETDIKILKTILSRHPEDLVTLKRLIDLTFTMELFDQTENYCSRYLAIEKNSETAYLKIISAASRGDFKNAADQIDLFINQYKDELNSRDMAILEYRKILYTKSTITHGYPSGAVKTSWGTDCIITTLIPRDGLLADYNYAENRRRIFELTGSSISAESKYPDYLTGLPSESINSVSVSDDGREVLVSSGSGDSSAIYVRKYLPGKKSWSDWEKPRGLNPGKWNHYPNFINNDTAIFSSADGSDYDIYISKRDNTGKWSSAEEIHGINTLLDEISIWVHPDGETVYFSSNGYEGMGGFDIYGARLVKSGDSIEVTGITNISSANTFRNEKHPLFVTPSAADAYFNFTIGRKHNIYRCTEINIKPSAMFFYNADISDSATGNPVNGGSVEYRSQGSEYRVIRTVYPDGFTGTTLRRNLKYSMTVSADGYEPFSKTISYSGENISSKDLMSDKIRLKRKVSKPDASALSILITSIKLIECEESKSLPVMKTLEDGIGIKIDGASKNENIRSFTVCGDTGCALSDGKTLNADYVVYGTLTKTKQSAMKTLGNEGEDQYLAKRVTGSVYTIELKFLDTSTGKVILNFKRSTGNPDALQNITKEFIKKIDSYYNTRH